ncbi:MAG: protein phosphatase 2C domain-containing protein [Pseudomonadota bacterium]
MRIQSAKTSHPGERETNQDRVAIVAEKDCVLLAVLDGMGGHADGEKAAQVAIDTIVEAFRSSPRPLIDPMGFLRLAINDAHDAVVALGKALPMASKPRATCAACLIQEGEACWAHVGDSRIYLLRGDKVLQRTRDHSHVELLRREGLISEEDMHTHPMRNYVEFCLGGEPEYPGMDVSPVRKLEAGDRLLLCSDGLWGGLKEVEVASLGAEETSDLQQQLEALADVAVAANSPYADNTTAAVVRFLST